MKLIELLARELTEWPLDAEENNEYNRITQDDDGMLNGVHEGWTTTLTGGTWGGDAGYLYLRGSDEELKIEVADDWSTAVVTRNEWLAARPPVISDVPTQPTTPTLETMLIEWRDLETRAQAAQAEADALFEHAGQCHGEIVVRLAELGWGAPRGPMVPGEPIVTLDEVEPWVVNGHTAPDDATHYGDETSQFTEGFYKLTGDDWMFRTITGVRWLTLGKNAGGDDTSRFISRPSTQP
jgi:hypothetical protein